jgi:mannitol 2-dehydrogenase
VGGAIPRLAQDGSNRQPKFILPWIRDRLAKGGDVTGLSLETALWCHHWAAITDAGESFLLDDPSADRLMSAARSAKDDPAAFVGLDDIFGDIADAPSFRASFDAALRSLWRDGTRATLQRYPNGEPL